MYTLAQLTQHKQEFNLIGEFLHQPLRLLTQKEAEVINEFQKDKYWLVVNHWYNVYRSDSLYLQDIARRNIELLKNTLFNNCLFSFKDKTQIE